MATTRKAQIAEAQEESVSVEFKGATFSIPHALDVSVDLLEAENELQLIAAILGDEQYAKWRELKPTLREMRAFSDAVADAGGFGELGN